MADGIESPRTRNIPNNMRYDNCDPVASSLTMVSASMAQIPNQWKATRTSATVSMHGRDSTNVAICLGLDCQIAKRTSTFCSHSTTSTTYIVSFCQSSFILSLSSLRTLAAYLALPSTFFSISSRNVMVLANVREVFSPTMACSWVSGLLSQASNWGVFGWARHGKVWCAWREVSVLCLKATKTVSKNSWAEQQK